MHFQPVGPSTGIYRSISPPPTRYRCEALVLPRSRNWPILQHDRLADGAPVDALCRNGAVGPTNVLADGEVEIMLFEFERRDRVSVPELGKPGVHIYVRLPPNKPNKWLDREVPTKVYQQFRGFG